MTLSFPEIDEAAASPAAIVLVEPAAATVDLSKINLTDVALAQFAPTVRDIEAAEKALKDVQHDLSTPSKLKDAITLRNRLIKTPLAEARKLSTAIKSKLTAVAKDVTAHEGKLAAEFDRVELYITPQIEARQADIAADEKREADRKAGHIARIAVIAAMLNGAEDKSAERLAKGIEIVDGLLVTGFEEFQPEAEATRTRVLLGLKALHEKAVDREAEAARIAQVAAEQAEAARLLSEERAQLARERAELEALRAAQVPAPVPPAPAPEPAPTPVEPVVQDPPPVFDRAGDEFAEPHMRAEPVLDAAAMPPAAEVFTYDIPASPQVVQDYRFGLPTAPVTRRTLVEADVAALVDHVMSAFTGTKFPTQPKPSVEWWSATRDLGRKLQQQIGAAA